MAANEYGEPLDRNGYAASVFPDDACYFADDRYTTCGSPELCRHEVYHHDMGGATRELSKRYGAWVTLCPTHHGHVHHYPQLNRELLKETQRRVMERYGWDEDEFRKHFGKNYL